MRTMRLIRNSVGSSMITMMVVMAALGGGGLLMNEMMMNSEKALRADAGVEAYKQLVDMVRKNLYSGNNCSATLGSLKGDSFSAKITDAVMNVKGTASIQMPMNIAGTQILMGKNFKAKTGIGLSDIKMTVDRIQRPSVRYLDGRPNQIAAFVTLFLEPDRKGMNIYRKNSAGDYVYDNLHIKLIVYYEDNGTSQSIKSCFGPSSDAAFCTVALNGSYDPAEADPNKRCHPDVQCFYSKTGVTSPFTGTCSEPGYVATRVGGDSQLCSLCNKEPAAPSSLSSLIVKPANLQDWNFSEDPNDTVKCDSTGYGTLSPVEQTEVFSEYGSQVNRFTASDQSAFSGCLGYQPPTPPTNTVSDSSPYLNDLIAQLTNLSIHDVTIALNAGLKVPSADGKSYSLYTPAQVKVANDQMNAVATNTDAGDGGTTTNGDDPIDREDQYRCFIAGTQVNMADGRTLSIEDVKLGDEVMTYDESRKINLARPVIKLDHHKKALASLYRFKLSNGNEVTSNDVHRFYVSEHKNYLTASEIYQRRAFNQAATLLSDSGEAVTILEIEIEKDHVELFNLHVKGIYDQGEKESDKNHNYYANGVLVHNIKQDRERVNDFR